MKSVLVRSAIAALWFLTAGCEHFRGEDAIPPSVMAVADEYRVGPSDVLSVSVWKQPDLTLGLTPIRPDGKISLPLLGDIDVEGLTALEINEVITERLKEFVSDPEVTVAVVQVNYPVVFLIGEINRPGPIPIRQNTTMLQVISMAGGFTPFADKDDVHIIRREGDMEYRIRFDYDEALKGKATKPTLYVKPGDVIVVED
ncbi:MAG: polysaccharide biosynthesis/export family protein [Deltaproteobacteria bacterium]|nr:polysaccharide biosynthesis/export family protein [Deltaproteobacteria bacterium]